MSYLLPTYPESPVNFTHGKACTLYDDTGKSYIDFFAGIAVTSLGHSHPELIDILQKQSERFWHLSNYYATENQEKLAEKLVKLSFPGKVFYSNSGAEANEGALKLARKYSKENFHKNKTKVIRFKNSFHGRTLWTLSLTENSTAKAPFSPYPESHTTLPLNDIEALEQNIDKDTAAVIVEPIQGEGGIHPCEVKFLEKLREKCNETGTLLIFDEIQCGIGRTGYFWGYQSILEKEEKKTDTKSRSPLPQGEAGRGIIPDIITFAKAIANGLPMGGFIVAEKYTETLQPGEHGTTFGGNPLATTVALKVVEIVSDPEFLKNVKNSGNFLKKVIKNSITPLPLGEAGRGIQIRGYGLMIGIESPDLDAADLVKKALKSGFILNAAQKNILRIVPPLIITKPDIEKLGEFLKDYFKKKQGSMLPC